MCKNGLNVSKEIPNRDKCLSPSAFYCDSKYQRSKVMKPMVHISVRHVYLCENPPSPNKVKGASLDCVFYADKRENVKPNQA